MTFNATSLKTSSLLRGRIVAPAVFALALSWTAQSLHASLTSATTALNEKLAEYAAQEATPPAAPKIYTVTNASSVDLANAVYDVVYENPNTPSILPAEVAAAALSASGSPAKFRKDADKISGSIVNAAIQGSQSAGDATTVKNIVSAVVSLSSLKPAGKTAAISEGLKIANTNGVTGTDLATLAIDKNLTTGGDAKLKSFAVSSLSPLGSSTGEVATFVQKILTQTTNFDSVALGIATSLVKKPDIAGEIIGGRARQITETAGNQDATVEALVNSVIANTKLQKIIGQSVAAAGESITVESLQTYATNIALGTKTAVKGQIASGAIQAASTVDTINILSAVAAVDSGVKGKSIDLNNIVAYAGAAAAGNGATDSSQNSKASEIALHYANVNGVSADTKFLLAQAIIKSIAVATPDGALKVVSNIITSSGGVSFPNASDKEALAVKLAKGLQNTSAAAGSAVAGVVLNDDILSAPAISIAAIKGGPKAAAGISQKVAEELHLLQPLYNFSGINGYAVKLAIGVPKSAANIATGVAVAVSNEAGAITKNVIVSVSTIQAKSSAVASQVATAIPDVEQVANIATDVGSILGTLPKIKLSSASSLASGLAKAINSKANVPYANRADEIGEVAASVVGQVLGRSSTSGNATKDANAEAKTISGIGTAIFKALGKKLYANSGNSKADMLDEAEDIAGSIAQTISVAALSGNLTQVTIDALLSPNGILRKNLVKSAGKYGYLVTSAFVNVNGALNAPNKIYNNGVHVEAIGTHGTASGLYGTYEIGSVVDPETPTRNG